MTLHEGECAAQQARDRLGLGVAAPLSDLLRLVEDAGVPVLVDRFGAEDVAGVLLRHADGMAFVAVNADHQPVRQRFTLAHEYGHLCMNHVPRLELASDVFEYGAASDPQEIAANYFAAEFLAPRAGIQAWLQRNGTTQNTQIGVRVLVRLAFHFGIAFSTTCYRLQTAGLISGRQKTSLLQAVGQVEWRRFADEQYVDTLYSLWRRNAYPRPPRETVVLAQEAREAALIDDEEFVAIAGGHERLALDDTWLT